jgi:hypothetical protein
MLPVVTEKNYRFTPPQDSWFWPAVLRPILPAYLRRCHGIASVECRGVEHLQKSLHDGQGILLAPNHCRPCDPMVLGVLSRHVNRPFFTMASAHLFLGGGVLAWMLPRVGAFSVYREGLDREALKQAITILQEAKRPLVVFPEGVISRTNDRLNTLMDGVAFMARSAAKDRPVVIHPVALRYFFRGEFASEMEPVLATLERRLSWHPQSALSIRQRIVKIGLALLALKEIERFGEAQQGELGQRLEKLSDHLLVPLETEWLKGKREGDVVARVKLLRKAILPNMIDGNLDETERTRRWNHLNDMELAQALHFFPPDYILDEKPTPERLMETVERFEEGLGNDPVIHRPLHAVIEVCEAVPVNPKRDRTADVDPVMEQIRLRLEAALQRLTVSRPL